MNEFGIIDHFFKKSSLNREDVIFGIGDDAACVQVPQGQQLLISTDTLVSGVHFLDSHSASDIAWRAVMVNISDMAAMAATPCWTTLALTTPEFDQSWFAHFSQSLQAALGQFGVALIGGDTTRGPLALTLTVFGTAPDGKAIRRSGAKVGDIIWVSGLLGAAALAVTFLNKEGLEPAERAILMDALMRPKPRTDLTPLLRQYAHAAIDISDGLTADLNHICEASGVGACLQLNAIPIHPLLKKYCSDRGFDLAVGGGDDYELCFTCSPDNTHAMLTELNAMGLTCYPVGTIEEKPGLRGIDEQGKIHEVRVCGYSHFQ